MRQVGVLGRIVLLLMAGLSAGPAVAGVELEARIWAPSVEGEVVAAEEGRGTVLDLDTLLGIEDEELGEYRLTLHPVRPLMVRLGYLPMSFDGSSVLSESIDFGGVGFPVDVELASEVELEYARVGVAWLFPLGREELRAGPLVELKGVRAEAALEGSVLGIPLVSAREEEEAAFGAAGVIADYEPLPTLHLIGEVSYSPGLEYGDLLELEAVVKFFPLRLVSLFGGYRLMRLDLDADDDRLDLDLSGFFVGGSVNF